MSLSNPTFDALTATAPDPTDLIADFGHPHFPGWMIIMALLLILISAHSVMPSSNIILRPRPARTSVTRLVRRSDDGGF
ncbi:MAG: hypothetical protein ACMZ66_13010 [Thalassospira sp.]|uniref:hypothetical protein n=1 Tax=Thalassospira sp. TaxID=1912094 RepID=UPI003A835416